MQLLEKRLDALEKQVGDLSKAQSDEIRLLRKEMSTDYEQLSLKMTKIGNDMADLMKERVEGERAQLKAENERLRQRLEQRRVLTWVTQHLAPLVNLLVSFGALGGMLWLMFKFGVQNAH